MRAGRYNLMLGFAPMLLLWLPVPISACNIPVFRFALERWLPDPYRVTLFHQGLLTGKDKEFADNLEARLLDANCLANCTFERFDLKESLPFRAAEIWQAQKNPTKPWLVVQYPRIAKTPSRNVYEGPLDADKLKWLLESPRRTEIARRLLQGTSAVWVVLESGNKKKDDAKVVWLEGYLKTLEKELKLPELTATPKDKLQLENLQLKIEFSLLRVARTDPAEALLVQILLGTEEDLDGAAEPIVFPVFGRGLVLHALVGRGINENTVKKSAQFLVGPCSCEVKEQNPGVDLLLAIDWEGGLTKRLAPAPELPPLTGLSPAALGSGSSPQKPGTATDGVRDFDQRGSLWRYLAFGFGGMVGLVAIASLVLWFRKR